MKKAPNTAVRAHFAACTRDRTPSSAGNTVQVLFAPFSHSEALTSACASVLSEAERLRLERIARQQQRTEFVQRRAFHRFCGATALCRLRQVSEVDFAETVNGRPYLPEFPDLWFSFSSCSLGMLGAWSSSFAVGVDMEDQNRQVNAVELARHFFASDEAAAIERLSGAAQQQSFYRLWTLKESALKSIGEGLPYGLDKFGVEMKSFERLIRAPLEYGGPEQFSIHEITGLRSQAALVTRNRPRSNGQRPVAEISCSIAVAAISDR